MIWNFDRYKHRIAITDDTGKKYSYYQLEKIGKSIVAKIPSRSLVLCLCKNSPGSVIGYLNFLNHGIVPILVDSKISGENVLKLIHQWKPMFLWVPEGSAIPFDYSVVFCTNGYQLVQTNKKNTWPLNPSLALLLNTSGTMGTSKLVKLSYQNIKSNIIQIVDSIPVKSDDVSISTLPMYYSFGLSIIHTHIYKGASLVITEESPVRPAFWKLVKENNVTTLSGVPFHYHMFMKLDFRSKNLDSVRTFTQAGGALSHNMHKQFARKAFENNKDFVVMYGQTEATARMSVLPGKYARDKVGSIGLPVPGAKIELKDDSGNKVDEPFQRGELIYYGENVFMGYANDGANLTTGDENNGILKTGDLGYMDDDGYLYITGRKSRFAKIHGIRVSFDEVENLLSSRFTNSEFGCTGHDNKLKVSYTGKQNDELIRNFLLEETQLHKSSILVQKLKVLPRNEAGKIMYHHLNKTNAES
ncbi:AMP-binding protein [Maribellus comscasis]|uniref:AMP-binding protein n=1 Tax=Maribellus comscasis TaxID=2681766 RepID=A0A6I6JRG4_9BACT|nr:AMP-binding protein [Maribellus comscasis]QGY42747.1 AMP-binding protein [Maribellus comscasis]